LFNEGFVGSLDKLLIRVMLRERKLYHFLLLCTDNLDLIVA